MIGLRSSSVGVGIAVGALAVAGCTSVEVEDNRFYRLQPVVSPKAEASGPRTVRVDAFTLAPHLASDRLISVLGPYRVQPYQHDFWAAPLDQLITDVVLRGLLESKRFRAVLDQHDSGNADLTVAGRVLHFEEVAAAGGWAGQATVAVALREERGGRLLWQGTLSETVGATEDGADHAVYALNDALGKVLTKLARIAEREGAAEVGRAAPGN